MELDRGSGVSLWRQIAQILNREISDSLIEPGGRLPTEQDLALRFAVNRHTIRRALSRLQEQGIIRIEQGRGTFVHEDVVDYMLGKRTRFSEILTRQSRLPTTNLLRAQDYSADRPVSEALNVPVGSATVVIDTIGEADGYRLCVSSRYYPLPRFAQLVEAFEETGSVTAALKVCGVEDYERRVTRVTARLPTAEDARYLHQPKTRPILVTESISVDSSGRPIEYGLSRFASDRTQIVVET